MQLLEFYVQAFFFANLFNFEVKLLAGLVLADLEVVPAWRKKIFIGGISFLCM